MQQVPVPAVVRGDEGFCFRDEFLDGAGGAVDWGFWSDVRVEVGPGTDFLVDFGVVGVGLGVRSPSLNSGNLTGVSMKLLRRTDATSAELLKSVQL